MIYFDFNNAKFKAGDGLVYNNEVYTIAVVGLIHNNRLYLDRCMSTWIWYGITFTSGITKEKFCNSFRLSRA